MFVVHNNLRFQPGFVTVLLSDCNIFRLQMNKHKGLLLRKQFQTVRHIKSL